MTEIAEDFARRHAAEASRWPQIDEARKRLGSYRSAAHALERALQRDPKNARLLTNLGYNYFKIQEYEQASAALEKASAADPALDRASIGLADSYMQLGDYAKATAILEALFLRGHRTFQVCRKLSQLPGSLLNVDLVPAIENLEGANVSDRQGFEAALGYVKAAVLHNAGRYSDAWDALVVANRYKCKSLRSSRLAEADSNAGDLARIKRRSHKPPVAHEIGDAPWSLFILGPSRCGKSSMERLVGALDGVERGFENGIINNVQRVFRAAGVVTGHRILELAPEMYGAFRGLYLEELAERAKGAAIFTNTMPELVIDAAQIAEIVPNARFMFVKRDIDDVAIRIFMKDYETDSNPYAYALDAIFAYVRWYHQMIDHLHEMLPRVSRIVRYEDLVEDPKAAVDVAADLCGVPFCERPVPQPADDRGCAAPYRELMKAAAVGTDNMPRNPGIR